MIPQEIIDDILNKADIVQVISSYINVIKKGNSYVAICPFHNDTNPSMMISPTKQIFKCFVCGAGGNVFTFVSKYEKISFEESVRRVAKIINYNSPLLSTEKKIINPKNMEELTALNDAGEFYHYILSTKAGENGLNYLNSRNITSDMIDYFNLGFSPENGELSIKQLRAKNHSVETLSNVGILIHEQSNFSDRFKNRIIFPIYNEHSQIIGFSARKIRKEDDPKFINSPSTEYFNKSEILYNYQNASVEAKRSGYCYIVEGFMDVFSFYRSGIKACIALMGTAFTSSHAKILRRLNIELRLCLDGDDAGQHGMISMIKILDKEGINYRIVNYEDDKRDPDEIFNQDGSDALVKLSENLIRKNEFIIKYFSSRNDLETVDGKLQFIRQIVDNYSYIQDDIERTLFLNKINQLTGLGLERIKKLFKNKSNDDIFDKFALYSKNKVINNSAKIIQRQLIRYMIESEEAYEYLNKTNQALFIDDVYILLANYIEEYKDCHSDISLKNLITLIQQSGGNENVVNELISIGESKTIPPYDLDSLKECLNRFNEVITQKNVEQKFAESNEDIILKAKILDQKMKKGD